MRNYPSKIQLQAANKIIQAFYALIAIATFLIDLRVLKKENIPNNW